LEQAVRRAEAALDEGEAFAARLEPLLESLAALGHCLTRLAVWDRDRIRVLDIDRVDWIGTEGEEVVAHVGEDAYPVRRNLAELAARLDPATFFRAHRSAIVNLDRVQEVIPWFKGSHKLRLTTGAEVDLSRRRARALREILGW
jgi:DNA-binding LytR/AlgR family response regulator